MNRNSITEENKIERIACRITTEQREHLEKLTDSYGFRSMSAAVQSLIEESMKKTNKIKYEEKLSLLRVFVRLR